MQEIYISSNYRWRNPFHTALNQSKLKFSDSCFGWVAKSKGSNSTRNEGAMHGRLQFLSSETTFLVAAGKVPPSYSSQQSLISFYSKVGNNISHSLPPPRSLHQLKSNHQFTSCVLSIAGEEIGEEGILILRENLNAHL
jgi:hypothetical protein